MRCREVNSLMENYLKGKLDGNTHLNVEEHLGACTRCQQNLLIHKSLKELVNEEASGYTDNPFFASRVISRIEARKISSHIDFRTRLIGYAAVAAALAIGLFIGNQLGTLGSKVISTNTNAEMLAEEYIPSGTETIYEYDFEDLQNLNKK
ncbi:MAG TPA: zf-HC2 domain-containing protein [Tenuifilum sp.]|uniref:anti-sigma factor family protein n=1 Tax=Tenuifilum sp. TaxID=2760880 RepID=UPI001B6C3386|nr:zf-HC2 domain-containing protein [Bacteroidales bacterium]HOU74690.1 zf-HC2 domain-containing protein [Tenuifilum sp.]HRU86677.1 zf-HC2 domain-containing protein [Tenuifilum sp.]